jgi:predicted DNA-binding antitoxin AbrB/MazE fold protein
MCADLVLKTRCIMPAGVFMTKEIEAIYEQGVIRPLQQLELPEGARLDLIVITHEEPKGNGMTAEVLAEIAALPLEGATDSFAGREHDSVLYPKK